MINSNIKSIILAAGQGSRLRPLTDKYPKGMVELNGVSLIQRQIDTIVDFVRLSDESDQKFNNDVLHLQIRLNRGEIPG